MYIVVFSLITLYPNIMEQYHLKTKRILVVSPLTDAIRFLLISSPIQINLFTFKHTRITKIFGMENSISGISWVESNGYRGQ